MKKVLFVISTLTGGGAERTVSTLSKYFPDEVESSVLLNSRSEDDYEFNGEIITLGMKPRVKKSLFYQIVAAFKRYKALKKLKKSNQYDVVISFMESANFLNIITGGEHCKRILSVRNVLSEEYTGLYRLILLFAKMLYKQADYVVALSEGSRIDLVDNIGVPNDKAITIYNGYDLTKIIYKETSSRRRFITMGRLVPQKGQWHLIRAFSEVARSYPDSRLQILGQGVLKNTLRELIEHYGLTEQVELRGFVNNPSEYLYQSDCFVFPSVYEGFGNAIIEALMNGLPVIASDFSVAREIIAPALTKNEIITSIKECQFGILTPTNVPDIYDSSEPLDNAEKMMAEAMISFIEGNIGGQYNDLNRRNCLSRFSIEKTVSEWKDLI